MEIIRVKDAAQGGKKAFELIQEGMANGAKVRFSNRKHARDPLCRNDCQ